MSQISLFEPPAAPVTADDHLAADQNDLRGMLMCAGTKPGSKPGWMTRADLCQALHWPDRKLRDAAETLGPEIVRCQLGFKLTERISRDDLPEVKQAIDAFRSQAKKMGHYADGLSKRLHALIG